MLFLVGFISPCFNVMSKIKFRFLSGLGKAAFVVRMLVWCALIGSTVLYCYNFPLGWIGFLLILSALLHFWGNFLLVIDEEVNKEIEKIVESSSKYTSEEVVLKDNRKNSEEEEHS